MTALILQNIRKNYGTFTALNGIDLDIPEGACVAFLGPSGCGKTTLLRIIAGLVQADAGKVFIGDEDATDRPASHRDIGMVFQSLALFPHLSVGDNITYALKLRGWSRERRQKRAEELLELVRLPGVGERHIQQLSGGQRQRVAIARALATDPKLLLLDEPLSALDAKLREEMQIELRQLQQRLGITTIIVTHDRREAMTISDLIVVMGQGHIQQFGRPLDIYHRPANAFVADFIGAANLVEVDIEAKGSIRLYGHLLHVHHWPEGLIGPKALISVRPENLRLHKGISEAGLNGQVDFIRDLGANIEIHVTIGAERLMVEMPPRDRPADLTIGDKVHLEIAPNDMVIMPK